MIEVFNKYFQKYTILKKYQFFQYNDPFNGIGEFTIQAQFCEENLYLFDKTQKWYVRFNDQNVMGRIEKVTKDSGKKDKKIITVKGSLMSFILNKRVIYGLTSISGSTAAVANSLIQKNIINPAVGNVAIDGKSWNSRKLRLNIKYKPSSLPSTTTKIQFQKTGGYVGDSMMEVLSIDNLGFELIPQVGDLQTVYPEQPQTNIPNWELAILKGSDRRRGNKDGNKPIIFSQSFSNIYRTIYEYNKKDYCNVAYVAGEGEGDNRTWIEVPQVGVKLDTYDEIGWNREELFIDARDIQKDSNNSALINRGIEKLSSHKQFESYEGTIVTGDTHYVYKKDFYKGDYVTLIDTELGIEIDAQITEVTVSSDESQEILDLTFGYQKISFKNILRRKGVI